MARREPNVCGTNKVCPKIYVEGKQAVFEGRTALKISRVSFLIKGIKRIIRWSRTCLHCFSPRTEEEQVEVRR